MSDVNMPKLSDTMEEGTVLEWKTRDGDEVHRGEVRAEIESDKASFEIEAEADGVLRIVVDQGQPVPVGQQIAVIGAGDAPPAPASEPAPAPEATESETPPAAEPAPAPEPPAVAPAEPSAAPPVGARRASPSSEPAPSVGNGVKASPLARRLAREMGVDLTSLEGTGPEGRIVKE